MASAVAISPVSPAITAHATSFDPNDEFTPEEIDAFSKDIQADTNGDGTIAPLPTDGSTAEDVPGEPFTGAERDAQANDANTTDTASGTDATSGTDTGTGNDGAAGEAAVPGDSADVATTSGSGFQSVAESDDSKSWQFESNSTKTEEQEFTFKVSGDVTRLEYYYYNIEPNFILVAPDGTEYTTDNKTYDNNGMSIEVKTVNREDDLNCRALYLENATEGTWTIRIKLNGGEKCFILAKTKVPDGWTQSITEQQSVVEDVITYHIDPEYGQSYMQILKMQDDSQKFKSVKEETKEQTTMEKLLSSGVVYLLAAVIVGLIAWMAWKNKRKKTEEKIKLSKAQEEYVKQVKEEYRAKASQELKDMMKEFDAEYTDEIEIDEDRDLSPKIIDYDKLPDPRKKINYQENKQNKNEDVMKKQKKNSSSALPSNTPSGRRRRFS